MSHRMLAVLTAAAVMSCNSEPGAPPTNERATTSKELRPPAPPVFAVQPYVLPNDQGYRHMTAFVEERRNELIVYGGLGNGGPFPPTPMNFDVFTLDLNQPAVDRDWVRHVTPPDAGVVDSPWFTSTRGFIELGGRYYLACDDANDDKIYSFNKDTYRFELLTQNGLDGGLAGDCCAVGVTMPSPDGGTGEERIYILGGRNDVVHPTNAVRYYSVTAGDWHEAPPLEEARSHLACAPAVVRGEPYIYAIAGGDQDRGLALRSVEIYDVVRGDWTTHWNYLPAGRTRQAVVNIKDKYLMLIGGDANCTGGACRGGDRPVTTVAIIDIKNGNKLLQAPEYPIPQLQIPRATPATAVRKTANLYELYVIGGRTTAPAPANTAVETTTETTTFDWRFWDR